MQRIPDADDLASSSDTGRSDSDSERQLLSFCEGCYVLKGTGEQCNLHGYGGAPLQSNNNFLTSFSYNEQWNKYCNYQGHMQNRCHFKVSEQTRAVNTLTLSLDSLSAQLTVRRILAFHVF